MPKILILDDDESFRRIYAKYLRQEGYEVDEASDPSGALEPNGYDVIVLDLRMPGVDGPGYIPMLRTAHPNAKILVASCYDIDYQRRFAAGAEEYFSKTDGCRALAAKIKGVLA